MNKKMLNLEIGKYYEVVLSPAEVKYAGRIMSIDIRNTYAHTYFISWPKDALNIFENPVGFYFQDYGWCEIHKDSKHGTCFRESAAIKCRELTDKESEGMRVYFEAKESLKNLERYAVNKSYEDLVRYRKIMNKCRGME